MSTRVLPNRVKDKVTEHWSKFPELTSNKVWINRIGAQLDYMNNLDESHRYPSLMDYIEKLDSIRPIKFGDVYSDWYKILKDEK